MRRRESLRQYARDEGQGAPGFDRAPFHFGTTVQNSFQLYISPLAAEHVRLFEVHPALEPPT